MQREIKFRAWDKRVNEMHQVHGLTPDTLWLSGKAYPIIFHPLEHFVLMQYTGLKDKNGKEIYEGDVVRVTDEDGDMYWTDTAGNEHLVSDGGIGQVSFDFGMWYVDGGPSNGLYDLVKINSCLVEVIGNVFENPELIEK